MTIIPAGSAGDVFSPTEAEETYIPDGAQLIPASGATHRLGGVFDDICPVLSGDLPHPRHIGRDAEQMGRDHA